MPPTPNGSEQALPTLNDACDSAQQLAAALNSYHLGDPSTVELLLAGLCSGGHVLLEGAPGLGKTRLVRALSNSLDLDFGRIQCTPDLMPSDVTGSEVLAPEGGEFNFLPGPIFQQILLVDEINRATPRTQSALLEAMEERQITYGAQAYPLPAPFFLVATQNPIEHEGTYPLPEAQLDRFQMRIDLAQPDTEILTAIFHQRTEAIPSMNIDASSLISASDSVVLPDDLPAQVAKVISATHPGHPSAPPLVREYVRLGASPRAGKSVICAAKGLSLVRGHAHVSPQDLADVFLPALRHRLILGFHSFGSDVTADDILLQVLENHPIG